MQNSSDAQLIADYLKGDEKTFEILVKRYLKPIYSFVYKNIGNPAEAENITQDVFVKIWKNLKKFNKQKNFKSWIFTIAKNASIDFLRKKKPMASLDFNEPIDCEISPEQKAYNKSKEDFLTNSLTNLSPKYKEVLVLRYQSNFTFRKIAEELDKPINTVKSWHRRGLLALRKQMA
ncbi:MAG: RNA polymerase sigma factor [Candidatus Pacebacteria bacterium]|nr:RNA polymerase sigma factor [Candidatus Paceibacterota bacterium]